MKHLGSGNEFGGEGTVRCVMFPRCLVTTDHNVVYQMQIYPWRIISLANHIEQITIVVAQASDVVHMEYDFLNLARAGILYLRQHMCLLTICPEVEQLFGTLFNMIFAIVIS